MDVTVKAILRDLLISAPSMYIDRTLRMDYFVSMNGTIGGVVTTEFAITFPLKGSR